MEIASSTAPSLDERRVLQQTDGHNHFATTDGIKYLDKFSLGGRYFEQFLVFRNWQRKPIHCRNDSSILNWFSARRNRDR